MPLHLLVKWEVVSPNSREGQLESISIYILYSLVLILYLKCGGGLGGGGECNVFSHFMLFPKKFVCLEILYSAPSLTATG